MASSPDKAAGSSPSIASKPSKPSTKGYTSLNDMSDDENITTATDSIPQQCRPGESDAFRDEDSDRDSGSEDEADVRLLPVKTSTESSSRKAANFNSDRNDPSDDENEEQCNVGERVELVLKRERALLSDSFDTDVEGGDSHEGSLILDTEEADYAMLKSNAGWRKPLWRTNIGRGTWQGRLRSFRSASESIFRLHSRWQIGVVAIAALLLIWGAMEGLMKISHNSPSSYFVRVSSNFPIIDSVICHLKQPS